MTRGHGGNPSGTKQTRFQGIPINPIHRDVANELPVATVLCLLLRLEFESHLMLIFVGPVSGRYSTLGQVG